MQDFVPMLKSQKLDINSFIDITSKDCKFTPEEREKLIDLNANYRNENMLL